MNLLTTFSILSVSSVLLSYKALCNRWLYYWKCCFFL